MTRAIPAAALAAGVLWLVRRRSKRKTRDSDDGYSVDSQSQASFTTSVANVPGTASRAPVLGTVDEEHPVRSRRRHAAFAWDQIAVLLVLIVATCLGLQRQAWDVVALLGVLLVLTLLPPISQLFRGGRRRSRSRRAAASVVEGEEAGAIVRTVPGAAQPGAPARADPRLVGTWLKDARASDPMNTACDIMCLNGVVRLAVSLVKGIELQLKDLPAAPVPGAPPDSPAAAASEEQGAGEEGTVEAEGEALGPQVFEMAVFSVVAWFKVRERYQLNGPAASWNRRDLRRGKHVGVACVLPDGGIRVDLEWQPPYAGRGYDEFRLENDNELHVTSHLIVGTKKHTYTVIYRRKGNWLGPGV